MEAARRRAVRDLREIAEEAEAPAGSDGAALRRRLAELRARVLTVARALAADAPPPPPRRERRPPDPLRPHNAPAAAPAKPPAPPAAEAPDAVAAAAGRLAEAAYRALERLFGVVDADHREAPARRAASPSTPRRSRASGACWGPSRAAASGGASTRSTPPPTRPRQMMMMTPAAARPGARATPRSGLLDAPPPRPPRPAARLAREAPQRAPPRARAVLAHRLRRLPGAV